LREDDSASLGSTGGGASARSAARSAATASSSAGRSFSSSSASASSDALELTSACCSTFSGFPSVALLSARTALSSFLRSARTRLVTKLATPISAVSTAASMAAVMCLRGATASTNLSRALW
jgi:hypothetical protein